MFGWRRALFVLTEHVPIRRGLRGSMWPALKGKREPGMEPVDTTINALVASHEPGDLKLRA